MNLIDLEHGLIGCFAIVGGSIGAATGAALAFHVQSKPRVAVAFFGDGATNQAYFHECLNFAAVRQLPVIFVCENNQYGEWTRVEVATAGNQIAARSAAYGMPSDEVDGNDVGAVLEAAREAAERAGLGRATARRLSSAPHTGSEDTRPTTRPITGPRTSSTSGESGIRSCGSRPHSTATLRRPFEQRSNRRSRQPWTRPARLRCPTRTRR